jgi:hypothetical protein
VFVAETIASLVLDWNIAGKTPDRRNYLMIATSNDIARRGKDSCWRPIIDPFGAQVRQLA